MLMTMQRTILFLCTGNYYRSRFAEEWFNDRATVLGLPWKADSAGLAENCWTLNTGPISPHTVQELRTLQVTIRGEARSPKDADPSLFQTANRIIAVYRREHEPMMQRRFPDYSELIEYWDLPDLDEVSPRQCLPKIRSQVEHLITELV